MRKRVLISFILALVLGGALVIWEKSHPSGGASPSSATPHLAFASPIELIKLNPDVDASLKNLGRNDAEYFHSWPIVEKHAVSDAAGEKLIALLNDPQTYGVVAEKCFEPEYAFRFGENTEVLLSLKCGRIHLIVNHTAQVTALSTQGLQALNAWLQENSRANSSAK